MQRLSLAVALALSVATPAFAQVNAGGSAQVNDNTGPNSSVVQPGIAKPPAGSAPAPMPKQPVGVPPNMANNPTAAQIAVQPSATVGSPVPVAGAGGTSSAVAGTNHQDFFITRLIRDFFSSL